MLSTNNSLILIYKGYSFKKGCLWPSGSEPSAVHSTDGPLKWADLSSVIKLNQVKTKALRITAVIQTVLWRRSQLQRRERRSLNRAQWRQSQTAMSCLTATGAELQVSSSGKATVTDQDHGGNRTGDYAHILSCQTVSDGPSSTCQPCPSCVNAYIVISENIQDSYDLSESAETSSVKCPQVLSEWPQYNVY